MGWTNSVALLQNFLRNLLSKALKVPPEMDVNPRQRGISGDAVVGCMDGADCLTRLRVIGKELRRWDGAKLPALDARHHVLQGFVDACTRLKLPVNAGKKVIQEFYGAILGGGLDEIRGTLGVAPDKGHSFVAKTCALLSVPKATQVICQHWSGLFCFAAGFRRPLFAGLEQIFSFIVEMDSKVDSASTLPNGVRDEILLAGLLVPLAFSNLRAPLREMISVSDASEFGGAAAEASKFTAALDKKTESRVCSLRMNALEEEMIPRMSTQCARCKAAGGRALVRCPLGCPEWLCSAQCYLSHRKSCSHEVLDKSKVLVVCSRNEEVLVLELVRNGISVEVETPGRKRTPDAALLLALTHSPQDMSNSNPRWRTARNAILKQIDAVKCQRIKGRLAILMDRYDAMVGNLQSVKDVSGSVDASCVDFEIKRDGKNKSFHLVHNLPPKNFKMFDSISFESKDLGEKDVWHPKVAQRLTLCIKAGSVKWLSIQFPVGKEEQQAWVLDCLLHSTRGFAKPGVAAKVCDEVQKLLGTVAAGKEAEHLSYVLQFCDFRGSEVSLRD